MIKKDNPEVFPNFRTRKQFRDLKAVNNLIAEEDSLEESKIPPSVTAPMQLRKRDLKLESKNNTSMIVTSPIYHQPLSSKPSSANKKVPKQQIPSKRSRPGCLTDEVARSYTRKNRHQD